MKINLQKKKKTSMDRLYYWLLALKVILGGVRYSIQNINLHCVVNPTAHELADKFRMSVKVSCS